MTNAMKHYLFSAFTLGISAFFFYNSRNLPNSAALFPRLIAALVALFSVLMAAQAHKAEKPAEEPGQEIHATLCFTVTIAVYIYLIPILGFFIITPIYIVFTYMYLKAANFFAAAAIGVLFSAFIYALFVGFLKLPVPLGLMEPFM